MGLTVLVRRADQVYIQSENGARPLERAAYRSWVACSIQDRAGWATWQTRLW